MRLLTTTFWSVVGEALSRGLLTVALVLVARILGTNGYGEFGLVRTTIGLFATLGGVGLGLTANRYVAKFRDTDKLQSGQIIGSSYLLAGASGALLGVVLIIGAPWLSNVVISAPRLQDSLRIAGALVALGAINGAQLGILQGLEAYRLLAIGGLVQGVSALVFLVAGAYLFGLNGALTGLVLYSCAGVATYYLLIKREMARQCIAVLYRELRATLPIFWAFSVPAALMGIAVAPFKWIAETLLARNSGFPQLGVFHAALTIVMVLVVLVSTVNSPLISLRANLHDTQASGRVQYVSLYGSWYLFLAPALVCILMPSLPAAIFGADFSNLDLFSAIVLLSLYGALLMYVQGVMRLVAQHGTMWFGLFTNLSEGIVLVAAFYAAANYGAIGLAWAYVISLTVRIAVSVPFLFRHGIVSPAVFFDKFFWASLLVLLAIVGWKLAHLA